MIAPSALLQEHICQFLGPQKSQITATVILFSKITVGLDFQNYRTVIIFTVEKGMECLAGSICHLILRTRIL